jgi:hypothetical protein
MEAGAAASPACRTAGKQLGVAAHVMSDLCDIAVREYSCSCKAVLVAVVKMFPCATVAAAVACVACDGGGVDQLITVSCMLSFLLSFEDEAIFHMLCVS